MNQIPEELLQQATPDFTTNFGDIFIEETGDGDLSISFVMHDPDNEFDFYQEKVFVVDLRIQEGSPSVNKIRTYLTTFINRHGSKYQDGKSMQLGLIKSLRSSGFQVDSKLFDYMVKAYSEEVTNVDRYQVGPWLLKPLEPIETKFGYAVFNYDTHGQIAIGLGEGKKYNPFGQRVFVRRDALADEGQLRQAVVDFLFENRDALTHDMDERLARYLSDEGFEVDAFSTNTSWGAVWVERQNGRIDIDFFYPEQGPSRLGFFETSIVLPDLVGSEPLFAEDVMIQVFGFLRNSIDEDGGKVQLALVAYLESLGYQVDSSALQRIVAEATEV